MKAHIEYARSAVKSTASAARSNAQRLIPVIRKAAVASHAALKAHADRLEGQALSI